MNRSQQVVVCVAVGATLVVVGLGLERVGSPLSGGGWFNYAPSNGVLYSSGYWPAEHPWLRMGLWLLLVWVWAGFSLLLFRARRRDADAAPDPSR